MIWKTLGFTEFCLVLISIVIKYYSIPLLGMQKQSTVDMCFRQSKTVCSLTLKAPITAAADDILKYFFIVFQRK